MVTRGYPNFCDTLALAQVAVYLSLLGPSESCCMYKFDACKLVFNVHGKTGLLTAEAITSIKEKSRTDQRQKKKVSLLCSSFRETTWWFKMAATGIASHIDQCLLLVYVSDFKITSSRKKWSVKRWRLLLSFTKISRSGSALFKRILCKPENSTWKTVV